MDIQSHQHGVGVIFTRKKTIDKNLRKYLLTLYYISMCQERKEPLSNKQNHVFGRPNCSRFECVFVFQHISSNTPSKNNQTKKEKSKYYESSIAKDVRNSVCSTHFPSRKNFKISFFSLLTPKEHEKCHIEHVSRDQSIEYVWMFNTKQTCFSLIFILRFTSFIWVFNRPFIPVKSSQQTILFAFFRKLYALNLKTQ